MKFKVEVTRTVHQSVTIEVEATDERKAIKEAEFMVSDIDFSGREKTAEYELEVMEKVQ